VRVDIQHIQNAQAEDTIDVKLQACIHSPPNKHEKWNEKEDHVKLGRGAVSIGILKTVSGDTYTDGCTRESDSDVYLVNGWKALPLLRWINKFPRVADGLTLKEEEENDESTDDSVDDDSCPEDEGVEPLLGPL
jgi:hypothetical protein